MSLLKGPFSGKKAIFFDLDGTLVDTAPDFVDIINLMRTERGLAVLPYDAIRNQVSNGAAGLVKACLNVMPEQENFEPLREELLNRYDKSVGNAAVFFDGGAEILKALENASVLWGIVTNKPERFTTPLLNRLMLHSKKTSEVSSVTICPDHVKQRKPHPESLLLAAQRVCVSPEECVYVGDHIRDIQAGNAAQMLTVGIANGYVSAEDNPADWPADFIVPDFCDLKQLMFSE